MRRVASVGRTRQLVCCPDQPGFLRISPWRCAPLEFIVSDGGASTDVRRSLATNPEILEGKKVVVWEFVERYIRLGKAGWLDVALPPLECGSLLPLLRLELARGVAGGKLATRRRGGKLPQGTDCAWVAHTSFFMYVT